MKKKKQPPTPNINLTHVKRHDGIPDGQIVNPDTGELNYFVMIDGLSSFHATDVAYEEIKELTKRYHNIILNQNALLTDEQQNAMKMQVLLWFREKIEDGNIY